MGAKTRSAEGTILLPDLNPLVNVTRRLAARGVVCALGGSGLLLACGLGVEARDWDLTTDSDLAQVTDALGDLPWQPAPHGDGDYATAYRLTLTTGGRGIDLMGRFSVRTAAGVCHLPTLVAFEWQGVPIGSPEVWAVAYDLIGRPAKALLLREHVTRRGADPVAVERLLAEPLPRQVRQAVVRWPLRQPST